MYPTFIVLAALLFASANAPAASVTAPPPAVAEAIKVDGEFTEAAWQQAPAVTGFLQRIRSALAPGDLLLLGADLVKSEADLLLAYDDPLGVTAAFNRNLLVRINRELGGDFDLSAFAHRAVWDPEHQRIEMHLVSVSDQMVRIPAADSTVRFASNEWIWTESSYKYTADQIVDMGAEASFTCRDQWVDGDAGFALTLFTAL